MSTTDEAIHAELDAIAGEYIPAGEGPAPGAGPQAEAPPPPMDWKLAAAGVVLVFDKVVAPNWSLQAAEKDMLAGATEQVLAAFFPNVNIDPRVQALLALGGAFAVIAGARIDLSTGKMTPLRKPREPEDGNATDSPA